MKGYDRITVEQGQAESPLVEELRQAGAVPVVVDLPPRQAHYRLGKSHLHLAGKRGEAFDRCASLHPKYICCSTHVLRALSNCPLECTYCFLQNYLTNATTTVVVDTDALVDEVRQKTGRQPWRTFRIGTWELGDSLALEQVVKTAPLLVEAFARLPNCILKLRTKTDRVATLAGLAHGGRTVVSWTVNPQAVIGAEEKGTASLVRRLDAMAQVADWGYMVGVHFDPMIVFDGWQQAYSEVVDLLFRQVPAERIPWISVGSLRFNPEMKRTLESRYPDSRVTAAEMVLGDDNKFRYVRPLREQMYVHLLRAIGAHCDAENGPFIYLCMERPNVWERVLGASNVPQSTAHLDYLMARSLHRRFPDAVPREPDLEAYLQLDGEE